MLWGIHHSTWVLIIWWGVIPFIVGTWYEIDRPKREDDWLPIVLVSMFWPVVVAGATIVGVGWCLAWIPRLPARAVIRIIAARKQANRLNDLPGARVVER